MINNKLTKRRIEGLEKPGRYADGQVPTLYLRVAKGGSKQWVQRLRIAGKTCDLGLGGFPLVTLDEARHAAHENRRMARTGGDPLADRRKGDMPTFGDAAKKTLAVLAPGWKHEKQKQQWMQRVKTYAYPVLEHRALDGIGKDDIVAVLRPIWLTKPSVAKHLRMHLRAVFSWAESKGFVKDNVAAHDLHYDLPALPKAKAKPKHYTALPHADLPAAIAAIDQARGRAASKELLKFIILTAVRLDEARLATWDEVDIEGATWTIPASRMKSGQKHRVPLSDEALQLLRNAQARGAGVYLFGSPTKPGAPCSKSTTARVLRAAGLDKATTTHGLRSTFRDWCGEQGHDRLLAEHALAHKVGDSTEQAYARSDLFDRRRGLMEEWSAYATEYQRK